MGLLPTQYVPRETLVVPMRVYRIAHPLFGREDEVQQVVDSLTRHRAAVVWGGPGEGKSSIAMEAACQLWEGGLASGGCFVIDCLGSLFWCSCSQSLAYASNSVVMPCNNMTQEASRGA